jgi:hypothetical protein
LDGDEQEVATRETTAADRMAVMARTRKGFWCMRRP